MNGIGKPQGLVQGIAINCLFEGDVLRRSTNWSGWAHELVAADTLERYANQAEPGTWKRAALTGAACASQLTLPLHLACGTGRHRRGAFEQDANPASRALTYFAQPQLHGNPMQKLYVAERLDQYIEHPDDVGVLGAALTGTFVGETIKCASIGAVLGTAFGLVHYGWKKATRQDANLRSILTDWVGSFASAGGAAAALLLASLWFGLKATRMVTAGITATVALAGCLIGLGYHGGKSLLVATQRRAAPDLEAFA